MKTIFTLLFSVLILNVYGQDRIPVDLAKSQITLNILSPSVTYEHGLNANQSIHLRFGTQGLSEYDNDIETGYSGVAPVLAATYRNYYPRKKVKKELQQNSGNYIGLSAGYVMNAFADNFDDDDRAFDQESSFFVGPVWGIQRNYKSGIHLGLSLGGGTMTGKNTDFDFTFIGAFELGFVINTK